MAEKAAQRLGVLLIALEDCKRAMPSSKGFLYGLGAMGEEGVSKALEIIHKELDLSMAFCGRTQMAQVDRSILLPGTIPQA